MSRPTLEQARDALVTLQHTGAVRGGEVRLEHRGAVAHLVLDHPEARNALSLAMMVQLADAVEALRHFDGHAVVLRSSSPGMFCAGGNLKDVRHALPAPERGQQMAWTMATVLDALAALPQVVIAAVDGPAVGGGAELLTAADFRLLSDQAWFQFRQVRLGVAAGWGAVPRLLRHVPAPVARRWLLMGPRVSGAEAVAAGYAEKGSGILEHALDALLDALSDARPGAMKALKQQILAAEVGAPGGLQAELFAQTWFSAEHRRALGLPDDEG